MVIRRGIFEKSRPFHPQRPYCPTHWGLRVCTARPRMPTDLYNRFVPVLLWKVDPDGVLRGCVFEGAALHSSRRKHWRCYPDQRQLEWLIEECRWLQDFPASLRRGRGRGRRSQIVHEFFVALLEGPLTRTLHAV